MRLTELQAYTPGLDDQHVVGHMFVDRPDAFALDYNSALFQSLQGDGVGAPIAVHPVGGGGGSGGHAVRNSVTGSSPLVLHFNGGASGWSNAPPPPPPLAVLELCASASFGRTWRLWAARRSQGEKLATGRPATASGARASRLRSRECHPLPLTVQAQNQSSTLSATIS